MADALARDQPKGTGPWLNRVALGLGDSVIVGRLGRVQLQLQKKKAHLTNLRVPSGYCWFLIYAEPHAMILASLIANGSDPQWFEHDPSEWSARIRLPLDPTSWRDTDIERFVVAESQRYLKRQ
jgi:hypothetical protein